MLQNKKFNIALIIQQYFDPNAGGVQRSTSKLAKIFNSYGHKVVIISDKKNNIRHQIWQGIDIYYLNSFENDLYELLQNENISHIINQFGFNVELTKQIRKSIGNKIYLINTLRINPLSFAQNHNVYISEFLRIKKLTFFNNSLLRSFILKYHYVKQNYDYKQLLFNVDKLVLLSESFKDEVYTLCPSAHKDQNKLVSIPNPFDLTDYDYSFEEKDNVILFVGRLTVNQKRVDLLMRVWKEMHNSLPDWKFWIVGYGEEEERMIEFCKTNNMERIIFFGKDNPESYYKKSKILHFTSAFEGFGNVLIEAQQYACVPVMFNSYSAAKDIINDGEDGFLVKPFDENEFIDKTMQLIDNQNLLQEMGKAAIRNSRRFSYESIYEKWLTLFDSVHE